MIIGLTSSILASANILRAGTNRINSLSLGSSYQLRMGIPFSGWKEKALGELSIIIVCCKGRPTRYMSLMYWPWEVYEQCSRKSRWGATFCWSRMSISGMAYFESDAVKMTTSKYLPTSDMNSQQWGRTLMKMLWMRPSISIGSTMSASWVSEKLEWTKVSSTSKIKVLRPLILFAWGCKRNYELPTRLF